jgi:Aspartyl protease/PDZ domain
MKIRRAVLSIAVPALLYVAPAASFAATSDPRVTTLIKESGVALHVGALREGEVVHTKGTVVVVGLSGNGESWNEMGRVREASTFSTPHFAGGSGWDGSENWNLDQTGLVIVDGSVLGRSSAIDQTYFGNYDLWAPNYGGASVTWGGAKSDQGKTYDVLTVMPPGSQVPFDVWFDRTTHLPVKTIQVAGPIVTSTTMSDFRPVQGLMIPFQVDTSSQGNNTSLTVTSADVNPPGGSMHLGKPQSSPHDFSIAGGATQTTIPIRISENHVYLDVMLNGKGPYHFIFDTGGANIVDTDVAKEIGAIGGGSAQINGVGNATESSSFATVKTLQVGDATLSDQVFTVLPVRKGFGMTAGLPADGLIGYEVISRLITTFDYANQRVILQMPGTYVAPAGASTLPIQQYGTQPQFACAIDSVPATCAVDTGSRASVSIFTPFLKANPSVVPAKLSASGVNGFGVGGPSLGQLGRMQTLSFGGLTLHDLVGDYTTQTQGAFAVPFMGANVGGGVWKRFALTLDYRKLTMTLVPNADFATRDHWDRSGVFLLNNGGAITIIDVRPGTPAAQAGLVKGEVITTLNGSSALNLRDVRNVFLGEHGTVVHLVVTSKDGTTHNVDLTLADYV